MPAPAAKTALGAKLLMGATANALTELAEVLSITPPKPTRDTLAASTLATTGGMDFIPAGLYDAGEISAQLHYIAGDATDTALVTARDGGLLRTFRITVKGASATQAITFEGYITSYGPDGLEIDGKQTSSLTVKITGSLGQGAAPAGGGA